MIKNIFDKPKIIGLVGKINSGKSNLIYYLIEELKKEGNFNLYVYGLRNKIKDSIEINSINELENIKNSIIILDEIMTMWDLDNRMAKRQIENTLRLLNHNNNILLICGVPENFKKFISGKLDIIIYKKLDFDDCINGSRVKNVIINYKGKEKGTTLLNLEDNETILYDGNHYHLLNIPYMKSYDTKIYNKPIINVNKNVNKK